MSGIRSRREKPETAQVWGATGSPGEPTQMLVDILATYPSGRQQLFPQVRPVNFEGDPWGYDVIVKKGMHAGISRDHTGIRFVVDFRPKLTDCGGG